MERISLLLGIHKALNLITPAGQQSLVLEWFQTPIELMGLQGESIRDYLLEQGFGVTNDQLEESFTLPSLKSTPQAFQRLHD